MNPRQRRGVLLVGLAAVGAIAVFIAVSNYVADVRTQVEPLAGALVLAEDLPPFSSVDPEMVRVVEVPERWLPEGAMSAPAEVGGRVSTTGLPAGTMLQDGMLVEPPQLAEGQRELAILVDAETGVGGKVTPGSVVDIFATFKGSDDTAIDGGTPDEANIVVENATVLDVGLPTTAPSDPTGAFAGIEKDVVPVTFALSVDESLRLAYIESFAVNVRLALRNPLDDEEIAPEQRSYAPERDEGATETAP